MTAPVLKNRAGVSTATVGAGTITLGSALGAVAINAASWQTFATSGVTDGQVVRYLILDSNGAWEYGTGTYTAAGTTLSRTLGASSTGSLLTLSGSAQVFVAAVAEDIVPYDSTTGIANAAGKFVAGASDISLTSHALSVVDGAADSVMVCGQDAFHNFSLYWHYNSDPTMGFAQLSTFAQANPLYLDASAINFNLFGGAATFYGITSAANAAAATSTITGSFIVANGLGVGGSFYMGGPTLQMGDDAASPSAKTLKIQSVIAGTPDTAGADFTITGSKGTGSGIGGDVVFATAPAGGSGTSQNAAVEVGRAGFMPLALTQTKDRTLLAGYGLYAPDYYEIAAGKFLEIGLEAVMEIG